MNSFEIELSNVKTELEYNLMRIDKCILGKRRDYSRRIHKLMCEYNEKRNSLDTQWLDIKLKLNAISDMNGRLGLMNALAENERNQRYYKERNDIGIKSEKSEMQLDIEELEIQKRKIRVDMEIRMSEIKERYLSWLESRDTQDNEKPTCNETV